MSTIALVDTAVLKPHERVSLRRAIGLLIYMGLQHRFPAPLLVDKESGTILDGHHRHWVAQFFKLKKIPCLLVDYLSDHSIEVLTRRSAITIDKKFILECAQKGHLFPHKTTRHVYRMAETPYTNLAFVYE